MLIRSGLVLLFLNCVRTTEFVGNDAVIGGRVAEFNKRYSFWPSVHNAAKLMRVRREAEKAGAVVQSEGGADVLHSAIEPPSEPAKPQPGSDSKTATKVNVESTTPSAGTGQHGNQGGRPLPSSGMIQANSNSTGNATVSSTVVSTADNETKANATITEKPVSKIDLNNPGVLKRGFIVFGGFALLAIAYFIFYRKKSNKNDTGSAHSNIDANQFRYGVLQSEDMRDNLELSRVPLTMESDDDEDEDLEIFDLEQKKKSLSYVNLQTNDEDVVFSPKESSDNDRDNLLLDIEDGTSDTLINWSSNGSKSIL